MDETADDMADAASAETVELREANRPCVVCGGCESEHLFSTAYEAKGTKVPFHMRRCLGCGLLFNSPRVPDARIGDYYDGAYYVFQRSDADYLVRSVDIYERTLGLLDLPAERRSVAEIGSGKGYLLALLQRLGWDVQGIELASEAARYAESTFGVPSFAGTVEDFARARPGQTFPVVACIDVLEHVPDPAAFVRSLAEIAEPGGLLVIDTPNGQAGQIEALGEAWRGFNPYHIYFFNPANLTRLLEAHGFEVLQSHTYNNRAPGARPPKVSPAPGGTEEAMAVALDRCRAARNYFATPDASDVLARDRRGENLLVLAVRSAG